MPDPTNGEYGSPLQNVSRANEATARGVLCCFFFFICNYIYKNNKVPRRQWYCCEHTHNAFGLNLAFCIETSVPGIFTERPFDSLSLNLLETERIQTLEGRAWGAEELSLSFPCRMGSWRLFPRTAVPPVFWQVSQGPKQCCFSLKIRSEDVPNPRALGCSFLCLLLGIWLQTSQS